MPNQPVRLDSFNLSEKQFPKVILVGNGISLASVKENAISGAEGIIKKAANDNHCRYRFADVKALPFPLQFLVASKDDREQKTIKNLSKNLFSEDFYVDADWSIAKEIMSLNADAILTTNYSYEFEMALDNRFIKRRGDYSQFTEKTTRREGKYQLHSFYQFDGVEEKPIRIWHIHGEASNYSSIVIGHDMYGNILSKYQQELSNRIQRDKNQEYIEQVTPFSWIDYFIFGDVYIMGFSLSENEYDLWWLLNRKKREKLPHGNTYFFDKDGENIKMRMLFDALDIKEITTESKNYSDYYYDAISHIRDGK